MLRNLRLAADKPRLPALVLFYGIKEHGLPEAYISALETTAAKIDADALRTEKNFAIANTG